jgi:hypothetical protein
VSPTQNTFLMVVFPQRLNLMSFSLGLTLPLSKSSFVRACPCCKLFLYSPRSLLHPGGHTAGGGQNLPLSFLLKEKPPPLGIPRTITSSPQCYAWCISIQTTGSKLCHCHTYSLSFHCFPPPSIPKGMASGLQSKDQKKQRGHGLRSP